MLAQSPKHGRALSLKLRWQASEGTRHDCYLFGVAALRQQININIESESGSKRTISSKAGTTDSGSIERKNLQASASPLRRTNEALHALKGVLNPPQEDTHSSCDAENHKSPWGTTLPLSPIMDPQLVDSRNKWKQPKVIGEVLAALEHAVASSAFARMLAAPIRTEVASEARVPSTFLQSFSLREDPSTRTIWQLPVDKQFPYHGNHDEAPTTGSFNTHREVAKDLPAKVLPTTWISCTKLGMEWMIHRGLPLTANPARTIHKILTSRLRDQLSGQQKARVAVKRNNVDLIQDLLRKRCAHELLHLAPAEPNTAPHLMTGLALLSGNKEDAIASIEYALEKEGLQGTRQGAQSRAFSSAFLLWLGEPKPTSPTQTGPQHRFFGTTDAPVRNPVFRLSDERVIPVLDVETLMGPDQMLWLRSQHSIFQHSALIVKQTEESSCALGCLWRLHLY